MKATLLALTLLFFTFKTSAQCPPNIDFEMGNFNGWQCSIGKTTSNGSLNNINLSNSSPTSKRHELMSSKTDKDQFGDFPVVCPFGGNYSVKLGNNEINAEAEGISYTFTVPPMQDSFTFTFFYAVVFQDPGHDLDEQPRFLVKAYEVATGNVINCASYTYVSTSSLPGFYTSKVASNVLYRNWTPSSIRFTGLQGKQVRLEFKNADCTLGGHWGYSYLDVGSGCSKVIATAPYCIETNSLNLNGPYGFDKYTWLDSSKTNVVGTTQNIVLSPPPTYTGTFYVDAVPFPGYGCRDTFQAKVLPLNIPPLADIPSDFYFCQFQTNAVLNVFSTNGNAYIWYKNDTLSAGSELPPIINTSAVGDFVYYVSQKQLFGCEGYKKKVVVHIIGFSNSPITVNKDKQCLVGNSFTFTSPASNSNNIKYAWYFTNTDSLINFTDAAVTHKFTDAGIKYVRLKVGYLELCTSIRNIAVTVIPSPLANFTATSPICEKQTTISFAESSSTVDGSSPINRYWWSINGNIYNTKQPPNFSPIVDTAIVAKYLVSTADSCISDTSNQVLVVQQRPNPAFAFKFPPLCSSEDLILRDSSFFNKNQNNDLVSKWNWLIDGSTTFNTQNPNAILDSGVHTIRLTVESNFGCKSLFRDTSIYVNLKPYVVLSLNDSCINKRITYLAKDTHNIVKDWYWNLGLGYSRLAHTFTTYFPRAGAQPFSVIGKADNGCYDTVLRNFAIYDNIAFAGRDTVAAFNEPVQLDAKGYPNTKYFWKPNWGLSNDTIVNPIALYNSDITYFLHSISKEGCVKNSKIQIKRFAGPAIYVATAFTPNGDKKNDVLHAFPVGIRQFLHFSIYNRAGNLVFTTKDQYIGWDGTFNGVVQASGTFVVVAEAIDYRGNTLNYKGTVVLIR